MTPETASSTFQPEIAKPAGGQMGALLERKWALALFPSLTDLLFVAIIAWSFMSAGPHGWQSLLADGDAGWHIRTGEYILDHQTVPHHDLYSFSKPGAPWYAWEWLSDVADAELHRAAGLKGVVLAAAVIIGLVGASLMWRMVMAGAHPFAALVVCLFSISASSIHFLARPHIYTMLLISLSMGLLEAYRRGPTLTAARRLWWLVPITLFWTNLHGGFLILVLLLGLATVGAAAEAYLDRGEGFDWRAPWMFGRLTLACAAVSFINPYGWGLHKHVIEYLHSDWIRDVVQEFQSPRFRGESMMQFEALLFVGLIAAGLLVRRQRVVEALWILACSYLALSSARHIPVFAAAVSPLVAMELTSWWKAWTDGKSRKSVPGILDAMAGDLIPGFRRVSLFPVLAVAALAMTGKPIEWPKDFPVQMFPIKMIHAHEAQIRAARLITTDQWADYLIYLHPDQKVFVDGRSDFYGPEIGNEFVRLMGGAPEWERTLQKYGFNLALVPVDCALSQMLKRQPGWRVVEDDGKQILLELRNPKVLVQSAPSLSKETKQAGPRS